MSGRISSSDIEEVKARVNIADVIGTYVSLKPASAGSLKGLCPFHQEKSPSFNVRPAQGFYHCFGCGAGGDVYKFLQEMESLSFYEAVENLASKVGYQLNYESGSAAPNQAQKARIYEANSQAAKYFQDQLATPEAAAARDFLKSRGFDKQAAELFSIGYAPKGWGNLSAHLTNLGFTEAELVTASLASRGERGLYDKFRGRIIWPIKDPSNQVIGFGARKLYEDDQGPKYLNTAETPVYHKSAVLYGLDLAKKEISKQQQVVVVEGYTDVMACYLAGVKNAVATCGTAFGDDHIRILNRMLAGTVESPAEVIFTFDPDEAGQKAAMRAFQDADKFQANSFIAVGPEGLDPCDLRQQRGDAAVIEMIMAKRPIHEFAIKQRISNFDLATVEGRVGAARAAAPAIASIRDKALKPAYIRELANWVNLDVLEVANLVERAEKEKTIQSVAPIRQSPTAPSPTASNWDIDPKDPTARMEKTILEVLLQHPELISDQDNLALLGMNYLTPAFARIAEVAGSLQSARREPNWLSQIANQLEAELHGILRALAAAELPASNEAELAKFISGVIVSGRINLINRQKLTLQAKLRQLDSTDSVAISEIQRELVALEEQRRKLQNG